MATRMQKTSVPGIYKRGNQYVVVWRHRGKQHKEAFRTMAEARESKGGRMKGARKPPSRQTFEEYAEVWMRSYRGSTARGLADNTREAYHRSITKWAIPFLGRYRMSDIGPKDLREFVAWMETKGARPPTIRKNLAPVKILFATAYEDEEISSNPAQRVKPPVDPDADDKEKQKHMTREELGALLAAMPEVWQPFFTFLAQTGLRISEAAGLTWGDLELGTKPVVNVRYQLSKKRQRVRPKTKNSRRTVPLSPGMAATMLELRAKRYTDENGWVWPSARGGALHINNVRHRVLAPVAEQVGMPWVGFHAFRHTCASLLIADSGKNIIQISRWLGHANVAITLGVYGHLLDDGVGEADFFDRALAPVAEAES